MNPLLRLLQGNQQQQQPTSMIDKLNQTMDYVNQNGGNAEQLARSMAEKRGLDINQVLSQANDMYRRFQLMGLNLGNFFKRSK